MKNKNGLSVIVFTIIMVLLVLGAVGIIWVMVRNIMEPHFTIYKNESGELIEVKDNIISWCYSETDCGKIKIGEVSWKVEWLEENCECIQINCEYAFNSSKMVVFNMEEPEKFTAKTFEGFIWFTTDERGNEIAEYYYGDVELIEKCNPCQEYKCGKNYMVEVWNQIK